jgi:hypothetical protein
MAYAPKKRKEQWKKTPITSTLTFGVPTKLFDNRKAKDEGSRSHMAKARRACLATAAVLSPAQAQQKRPNIVILMTDDTGWNDFGAYTGGGAALGHPTPNIDRVAQEGALFTCWYGQARHGGPRLVHYGRIPIRLALSVVTVPGDLNGLRKETPTIAEFLRERLRHLPLGQAASRRQTRVLPGSSTASTRKEFAALLSEFTPAAIRHPMRTRGSR